MCICVHMRMVHGPHPCAHAHGPHPCAHAHVYIRMATHRWVHRLKGGAELALTAAMLHAAGYMLLDRNDDANGCHTCTEVLYGRVLC